MIVSEDRLLLAWDYSSRNFSLALVCFSNGTSETLFLVEEELPRTESTLFFRALYQATNYFRQELEKRAPDGLVVGTGPGSYNGLRVSMATAEAMSAVWEVPLLGFPSPWSWSNASGEKKMPCNSYWALGDARGGKYWVAAVEKVTEATEKKRWREEPLLLSPSAVSDHLKKHRDLPVFTAGEVALERNDFQLLAATPSAPQLASLGHHYWQEKVDSTNSNGKNSLELLYLKPPHITIPGKTR